MTYESTPNAHSRPNDSVRYDATLIKTISAREVVRQCPWMFVGSTDGNGLDELLEQAVRGTIRHFQNLEQSIDQITVRLEVDESATIVSQGPLVDETLLA